MKHLLKAAALAGLLAATGAQAADLSVPAGGYKDGYVADTWWNAGDVFVRVRAEAFVPDVSTSNWNSSHASLGANPDLSANSTFLPELDLSYFITKNLAVELICCVGQTTVQTAGSIAGLGKVGDTWFFPPTLMSQYHFDMAAYGMPQFKPYVGAGGGYVWFFDENPAGSFKSLKLHSAPNAALQAGFDYHLAGNWFANFDFKYMVLGTDFSTTVAGSHVTGHVDVDPIVVGAGIGYRFGGYLPLK
ncbi:MAG: OmpW/AlkL family protein [Rhodomicrobium sp.]